jgi:carbon monoxide dehydrogenase subunit G
MFTIETNIEKSYNLSASKKKLSDFFSNPKNFATYMSDIIHSVEVKTAEESLWTIKIEISSSSSITVKLDMVEKIIGEGLIKYSPVKESQNHLAFAIKISEQGARTQVNFNLDLKLERKSGFDIHPLASFLGERAVNKMVSSQAEEYVDSFVKKAETQAKK